MKSDMASGFGQADLTLNYQHREGGVKNKKFSWKDFQVASAEFVGTFFLAFCVSATKVITIAGAAPFAIGLGLVTLVYTTGQVSGGQLNPAVTIGLVTRNKLNIFEALYCLVSQFTGAVAAGLICYALYGDDYDKTGYPKVTDGDRRTQAFFAELIQTFALVTVVLNTATTKAQANNSYFGVAIGFVVLSGALVIGGVTGACFNPAISMLTILHKDHADMWVFLIGPTIGGLLAGIVFRVTNPTEWDDDTDPLGKNFKRLTKSHHNPEGDITRTAAMLTQEFIGTFFLVWTVAMTRNATTSGAYIAVGAILTSMVYAGGAISGGHYNPTVTLGVYIRGMLENNQSMRVLDSLMYVAVQLAGGFTAAAAAAYVDGGYDKIAVPLLNLDAHTKFACVCTEFLFSFLLVLTVLNAATSSKVAGNSYFGLAIGFVITVGGIATGDFTGGCFNPSVIISLTSVSGKGTDNIWVYLIGEILGAIVAAGVFTFWHYDDNDAAAEKYDSSIQKPIYKEVDNGTRNRLLDDRF